MIETRDITKCYGNQKVLKNISVQLKPKETTVLIGPSGCGKSTLMRIMLGLISADSGSVFINGEEVQKDNLQKIRQSIGYVVQKGGLFPHLTIKENCTLLADYLHWESSRIKQRLEELIHLTNLNYEMLNRYPDQLSGGQQQRVALIRALMLDPDLLLLDEPLGSIDPLVRYELQTDLKAIFKKLNKTVLLVTHDLGEAAYLGDTIVLMKEGIIEQMGTVKEIVNHPKSEFARNFIKAQRSLMEFES